MSCDQQERMAGSVVASILLPVLLRVLESEEFQERMVQFLSRLLRDSGGPFGSE